MYIYMYIVIYLILFESTKVLWKNIISTGLRKSAIEPTNCATCDHWKSLLSIIEGSERLYSDCIYSP